MQTFTVKFDLPCGKRDSIMLSATDEDAVRDEFHRLFGDKYKIVEVTGK